MSIRINQDRCIGCKRCVSVCRQPDRYERDGKGWMHYPKDCWGCVSCVKECPVQAIDFYLGADMGGRGSTMNVTTEGQYIKWHIRRLTAVKRRLPSTANRPIPIKALLSICLEGDYYVCIIAS